MAILRSRCGHYIFVLWFLLLSFFRRLFTIGKKLVKQQYLLQMSSQYREL